jgi:hypothetical protein
MGRTLHYLIIILTRLYSLNTQLVCVGQGCYAALYYLFAVCRLSDANIAKKRACRVGGLGRLGSTRTRNRVRSTILVHLTH